MNIMNIMFSITDATTNLRAYTFIHDGKKRFQSREVGRKRELSEQLKLNLSPRFPNNHSASTVCWVIQCSDSFIYASIHLAIHQSQAGYRTRCLKSLLLLRGVAERGAFSMKGTFLVGGSLSLPRYSSPLISELAGNSIEKDYYKQIETMHTMIQV